LGKCVVASWVHAQKFCDRAEWTVVTIDAFQPSDLATLIRFVEAIQEHERIDAPDLKSGSEIGPGYAQTMVRTASEKNGCIRMTRVGTETAGPAPYGT
jgi:hypothetical protein